MQEKKFEFDYYAPTEKEKKIAKQIRGEYAQEDDALQRLQALDKRVKNPPMYLSIAFGAVGTLIFGGGLSLVLEFDLLFVGCLLSALGLFPIALAYPVYKWSFKRRANKYRQEILQLADSILKEEK